MKWGINIKKEEKNIIFLLLILIFLCEFFNSNLFVSGVGFLKILTPFFIALVISYIINTLIDYFNLFFSRWVSIILLVLLFLIFILFFVFSFKNNIIEQFASFYGHILKFIMEITNKYNFSLFLDNNNNLNDMFLSLFSNIYDCLFYLINNFLKIITNFLFGFMISIYLTIDFKKIKNNVSKILKKYTKVYEFLSLINFRLKKYIINFCFLSFINVIEYGLVFLIIGHNDWMFLGIVAGILGMFPIIGGIMVNALALMSAFMINYGLFIRTLIGILVLSIMDSYIINPLFYSKTNNLSAILIILSVYVCGSLGGFVGILLAIPFLIIVMTSFKYFVLNQK